MGETINQDVRHVIEEIEVAYHEFSDYNAMNGDYAEFAGMAIGQFRDALRDPELTRDDLKYMLRKGMHKYRKRSSDVNWTTFVASYMTRTSNVN